MTYSAMSSFKGRGCLPSFRFSHEDSPPPLCVQRSGGGLPPFVIRIGAGCPAAARHPNKTPSFSAVCGERAFFIWNKAKENTICNTVLKIYNLLSSAAGMSANERPSCRIAPLSRGLCAAPCCVETGWVQRGKSVSGRIRRSISLPRLCAERGHVEMRPRHPQTIPRGCARRDKAGVLQGFVPGVWLPKQLIQQMTQGGGLLRLQTDAAGHLGGDGQGVFL